MAGDGEAASASSSSFLSSKGMYDAFLSFRGKDTRNLFTDFLYRELRKHQKLQVFRDEPGLEPGDEIKATLMEAIKRSRMFIVVMSPNYLASRWCLVELKEMLKYSNKKRRSIFPIFYHVEPSEMRFLKTKESKEAMETHERRYGKETVDSWKSSLNKVSGLSGDHIVENKHYESKVMEEIVKKILAKHQKIKQLLNRFDSQFEAVESLLNLKSRKTLGMVGIYEEDGKIGITSFAFELYYKIKNNGFQEASFLRDVSKQLWENNEKNVLENLKKEILSDMDVEESTKQRLKYRRVLVVLEGVDNEEHLKLLLGEHGILGDLFGRDNGSRIIITTENKNLFEYSPVMNGAQVDTYCIREGEFDGARGSFTMMEENAVGLEEDFDRIVLDYDQEANAFESQNPLMCPPELESIIGTEMTPLICGACYTLLMYTSGATSVKCLCCHTVNLVAMQANQLPRVNCGSCKMLLMYPYGATSVKCAVCSFVTSIGGSSAPSW